MFRTILLGNHIRQLTDELGRRDFPPNVPTIVMYVAHALCMYSSAFTPDDVQNIKEFAKRKDCLKLLSQATMRVESFPDHPVVTPTPSAPA